MNISVRVIGYICALLVGYLLGSIPTGYLVAKARGIDIRSVGSGNIGATNVFRYLGVPAGIFVLLVDAAKGWLSVAVASNLLCDWLFPDAGQLSRDWFHICGGLSAILGHNFTCWLSFKGGKGIATSAGVLTALVPIPLLIILAVWIVVFAIGRYVSLASLAASFTLPFATWITMDQNVRLTAVTGGMAILAIYKHRSNLKRLLNGTESRVGSKKASLAPEGPKPNS